MKRKVYDIVLKKYEPFHFYNRDGKLINICNRKYPKPHTGYQLWTVDDAFKKITNPNGNI